jgi:cGMP-dependent protein kinase
MDKSVNDVKMGSYQDGAAFGELALIYGSPRAATIMATDNCKLWRIKRGWYRGVVGQHRQLLHKEKVEFLPKVKAGKYSFKDILDKDQINTMAQLLKQEYFKAGDTIIREGEAGNTFYLIHTGEVEIYRKECGDKPIARWGEHKFFGEKALLSDDVRQATVVAAR